MQRGLVRRYFTMCCSIILTSIILLGVIFMCINRAVSYAKSTSRSVQRLRDNLRLCG